MAKIDDVQHLQLNSEKINHIFYVDSKKRNKKAYPYPQEYVIEFTEPYRNICGFRVLDVSLPRTMYNIDKHNNTISFSINNNPFKSVQLTDKDYDIDGIIQELTRVLVDTIEENGRQIEVSITCSGLSIPAENKNLLEFESQYPFVFDMKNSTLNEATGFDLWSEENSDRYTKIYTHQDQTHEQLFGSVQNSNVDVVEFEGPSSRQTLYRVSQNQWLAQKFESSLFQLLEKIQIYFGSTGDTTGLSTQFVVQVWTNNSTFSIPGQMIVQQQISVSAFNGNATDIHFNPSIFGQNVAFQTGEIFWVVVKGTNIDSDINPNVSGGSTTGYYGVYGSVLALAEDQNISDFTDTFALYNPNTVPQWDFIDPFINGEGISNPRQMNITITTQIQSHSLASPGLIQLTGERYVVLRCPEIEQHMFKSLSYGKFSAGIGLFRLGVMGFSDIRYDFGEIQNVLFHPIGKLDKLTFRFERPDGSLYDFKGVNNTLILALTYYQPKQKYRLETSILNPDYTPDFMLQKYRIDDREKSDDEDDTFDFQQAKNISQQQLQKYYQLQKMYNQKQH